MTKIEFSTPTSVVKKPKVTGRKAIVINFQSVNAEKEVLTPKITILKIHSKLEKNKFDFLKNLLGGRERSRTKSNRSELKSQNLSRWEQSRTVKSEQEVINAKETITSHFQEHQKRKNTSRKSKPTKETLHQNKKMIHNFSTRQRFRMANWWLMEFSVS